MSSVRNPRSVLLCLLLALGGALWPADVTMTKFSRSYSWYYFGDRERTCDVTLKITTGALLSTDKAKGYFVPQSTLTIDSYTHGDDASKGESHIWFDTGSGFPSNPNKRLRGDAGLYTYHFPAGATVVRVKVQYYTVQGLDWDYYGSSKTYTLTLDQAGPAFQQNWTVTPATDGSATKILNIAASGITDAAGTLSAELLVGPNQASTPLTYTAGASTLSYQVSLPLLGNYQYALRFKDNLGNMTTGQDVLFTLNTVFAGTPSVLYDASKLGDAVTVPLQLRQQNTANVAAIVFTRRGTYLAPSLRDKELRVKLVNGLPNNAGLPTGTGVFVAPNGSMELRDLLAVGLGSGGQTIRYDVVLDQGTTPLVGGPSPEIPIPLHNSTITIHRLGAVSGNGSVTNANLVTLAFQVPDAGSGSATFQYWTVAGAAPADLSAAQPTVSQSAVLPFPSGGVFETGSYWAANSPTPPTGMHTVVARFFANGRTWTLAQSYVPPGNLDANTSWANGKIQAGTVGVGPGVTLTIDDNAVIALEGDDSVIKILTGGRVVVGAGAALTSRFAGGRWGGLVLEGGTLEVRAGARISGAVRAVAVLAPATVTLTGATLADNAVGLHLVSDSAQVSVQSTRFEYNGYGLKEDRGKSGKVKFLVANGSTPTAQGHVWTIGGTVFSNNLVNYYALSPAGALTFDEFLDSILLGAQ